MKEEEYQKMLNMLIEATETKKIVWDEEPNSKGAYSTFIGGCPVKIWKDYNFNTDEDSYTLVLANPDGRVFSTYSYSEGDASEYYKQLSRLYLVISDVVYRISESEKLILDGLKEMFGGKQD